MARRVQGVSYQTVRTLEARIFPSRLMTGTPKYSRRCNDAIRHVCDSIARNLPHGLNDLRVKGSFLDHVFMIRQSLLQFFVRRRRQAPFLGQVDDLGQADWGENNFVPGRRSVSMNARAGSQRSGLLSKYHRAACVSATPAITERPRQNRETSLCGFHRSPRRRVQVRI